MFKRLVVCAALSLGLVTASNASAQSSFSASYKGNNPWVWFGDKCTSVQPIDGYEPNDGLQHPVAIYLHGTFADWSGAVEGKTFAREAAKAGFVAASVHYDSWLTLSEAGVKNHSVCVFRSQAQSALTVICARPSADCSKGIVVMGHSQGAAIAGLARNVDPRVRAAYLIGMSGPVLPSAVAVPQGTRQLPNDRVRIVDGAEDMTPDNRAALSVITGKDCGATPNCLSDDGSGYYIVQPSDVADGKADHCYPWGTCTSQAWDASWLPPSPAPWGYGPALDWLKGFVT